MVAPGPFRCGAILYGGAFTLWALKQKAPQHEAQGHAFSLTTAFTFAAILAVVLLVAAAAQDWFGEAGVLVAAAATGHADTHSAAVSVASLVSDGRIKPPQTVTPVLAAFTANTLTKMAFAVRAGGRTFALHVTPTEPALRASLGMTETWTRQGRRRGR